MVDYVREITVKKSCKYGEYGSFEHLLSLFYMNSRITAVLGYGLIFKPVLASIYFINMHIRTIMTPS